MKTDRNRRAFLISAGKTGLAITAGPALAALLAGCETMGQITEVGSNIAASTGLISHDQAASLTRSGHAVAKTFTDITPEQEYYIGRTVGAVILEKYRPYSDTNANRYVNLLGQSLAQVSDMPQTYGGYHFLILDSDDINALSAPGGLIFVTRGLLRCCRSEDAAAAVLAHEIGHVQLQHGLQAIKKSRITSAIAIIGVESAKTFAGQDLANLTQAFEGAITDITKTLINNGYSRSYEYSADQAAATIMGRLGYDPNGLADMLMEMEQRLDPGGLGFAKTHPDPAARISSIEKHIGRYRPVAPPSSRQARFEKALGRI